MKVLIWSTGQDTGGQGFRIADAFVRHAPDWDVQSRAAGRSVLGYPEQKWLPITDRKADILALYRDADVVHLRNNLAGWQMADRGTGKPTLIHHHGSQFRSNHGRIAREARHIGAVQLAATIDLTLLEPDVQWMPSPYEVDDLAAMRRPHGDGRVRIAYFPTSPRIKSMGPFMAAYRRLVLTHKVELLTNIVGNRVRHMPNADVLALKAQADILFDQVILGYGNNAIEAMGMGIPVIAGVQDDNVRSAMLERWGSLPWYDATEATIYDALLRLVESADMRAEYAALGMVHVRQWHDAPVVVGMLSEVYRTAPPTRTNVDQFRPTTARAWAERRSSLRDRQLAIRAEREKRRRVA